jgi:hypothetical protein
MKAPLLLKPLLNMLNKIIWIFLKSVLKHQIKSIMHFWDFQENLSLKRDPPVVLEVLELEIIIHPIKEQFYLGNKKNKPKVDVVEISVKRLFNI